MRPDTKNSRFKDDNVESAPRYAGFEAETSKVPFEVLNGEVFEETAGGNIGQADEV